MEETKQIEVPIIIKRSKQVPFEVSTTVFEDKEILVRA